MSSANFRSTGPSDVMLSQSKHAACAQLVRQARAIMSFFCISAANAKVLAHCMQAGDRLSTVQLPWCTAVFDLLHAAALSCRKRATVDSGSVFKMESTFVNICPKVCVDWYREACTRSIKQLPMMALSEMMPEFLNACQGFALQVQ